MSNISLMSCPEDHHEPCGVKQSTYTYAVSVTVFIFDTVRFHPIKFCGEVYWLDVSNFGADANSRNESKCASNLTQLGFQDGEGIRPLVNQLEPRFPKPRNGGADGGSLIVCLSLFVK